MQTAGDFSADDAQFPGAKAFQAMAVGGVKSPLGSTP